MRSEVLISVVSRCIGILSAIFHYVPNCEYSVFAIELVSFIDLVLYNRLLRCFVVIEIKTGKITHQDLGQLQMYVNYHDRIEKLPDENPTIGILLCAGKNDSVVKMTLPENNKTVLASEYKLYLPTTEQLVKEIDEVKELAKKQS